MEQDFFGRPLESKPYEYKPKWTRMVDYSPDRNPSASRSHIQVVGGNLQPDNSCTPTRVMGMLQVRGVGVILAEGRADPETGKLQFEGMSIITKDEVGYAPDL